MISKPGFRMSAFFAVLALLSLTGCGGAAAEKEAAVQLRELGALVVDNVDKQASSLVLPSDTESIKKAVPLLSKLIYLSSLSGINTPVTDDVLVQVGQLKTLTNVDLSGTSVTNAGIAHLTKLRKLLSLNLASTKITSDCFPDIGKITSIDILNLANNDISGGFEHLASLKNLTWFVLSNLKLTDEDAAYIAEYPSLKRLSIAEAVELSETAKEMLLAKGITLDLPSDTPQAPPEQPEP